MPVGCTIKSYEAHLQDTKCEEDSKSSVVTTKSDSNDTECASVSTSSAVLTKKRASVNSLSPVAQPAKKACHKSFKNKKSNEPQFDVSNDWD